MPTRPIRPHGDRNGVVFFLIDGARVDVIEHLLGRGDLPNIARLLVECGGMTTGTTVFPSTTGVAYVPFLFGTFPGTAGIPGIRWLDRGEAAGGARAQWRAARSYCGVQAGWLNSDITVASSIFDVVPDSIAICSPITRGLGDGRALIPVRRALLGSFAHYTGTYQWLDDAVADAWVRTASRTDWRFLFVVFPGPDGLAHLKDPWHLAVLESYRAIDRALGRFDQAAARHRGRPHYFAASDHGVAVIRQHTDIALALESWGTPTVRHPAHVWRRGARAAVMVSGNAGVQIYLEPRSGHTEPHDSASIPREMVDRLVALPAVRLAAMRDERGGVRVIAKTGEARVHEEHGVVAYEPVHGDPMQLGYTARRASDAGMLLASRSTDLPDGPRQLLQLFETDRAGDIALSAEEGFDFRGPWEIPEHRSGHGSLHTSHMHVPILSSLPLPASALRTVDLMPTMLGLLGETPRSPLDGVIIPGIDGQPAQHPAAMNRNQE